MPAPSSRKRPNAPDKHQLQETRNALLNLHKELIDSQREQYEKTVGPIPSPNHFLKLLTQDPWFAWLQPLSQLIVTMDEVLEEKEPLTAPMVDALLSQSRSLLVPEESNEGFSGHYFAALQEDPGVVMAHAAAIKLVGRRKPV